MDVLQCRAATGVTTIYKQESETIGKAAVSLMGFTRKGLMLCSVLG